MNEQFFFVVLMMVEDVDLRIDGLEDVVCVEVVYFVVQMRVGILIGIVDCVDQIFLFYLLFCFYGYRVEMIVEGYEVFFVVKRDQIVVVLLRDILLSVVVIGEVDDVV